MTGKFRSILTPLLTAGTLLACAGAFAAPKVVVTVDVESQALALPDQVDAICSDGSACGLMAIAEILRERQVAGTFFLNVYESRIWGESLMADIAKRLQRAGQDVALHTHPQWAYDPSRNGMHQYSLDEQTAIVRDGVEMLKRWTGRPVVAHRAGDYSADAHTIDALQRNGIRVDSSLFPGNPRSRLTPAGLPLNTPSSLGSVIEIPVTIYQREERPKYFGDRFAPNTTFRKIDPDWFVDKAEARRAIDGLIDADCPFIVVFLHSFSLTQVGGDKRPLANRHARDIFVAILDLVREKGLGVVTMREIADLPPSTGASRQRDVPPRVAVGVDLHRYLWHRVRNPHIGDKTLAAVALAFAAGAALLIVPTARRRRFAIRQQVGVSKDQCRQEKGS